MPNLSIKNVPEDVAARLRARARANHRSLQGELLDLACLAELELTRCRIDASAQFELAERTGLTAYDAAYLQLALELRAPLATFDRKLGKVAARLLSDA